MRWLISTLIGLVLLPATAGLSRSLYVFLVGIQSDATTVQAFMYFLMGAAIWILIFVFLNRPVRLYILGHELCHLLAAWASGVRGGRLAIHKHGGSVEVEKSTFWIAMAPYMVPLYSLLLLLAFSLMPNRQEPWLAQQVFPGLLGLTWSFHLTFTLYAISQPQSDFQSYGLAGSVSIILFFNILLLTLMAAIRHPLPFGVELRQVFGTVSETYVWVWEKIFEIKNTLFQG